jgi:hypothetical protein
MRPSRPLLALCAALALALSAGCATTGGEDLPSMPAARIALLPEYRIFYDALIDYGDWVLVEPYGFAFRPRVDEVSWRPYWNGYWAASDLYGWVWVSADAFGWATEHYGRWLYDDYKGWVWVPGRDWGPAWVTWQMGDDWAGWAPLSVRDLPVESSRLPGGSFVYAPVASLAATNVNARLVTRDKLDPDVIQSLRPVKNEATIGDVRMELGPPIATVERAAGMTLPRVRLDDAIQRRLAGPSKAEEPAAAADTFATPPRPDVLRRAGEQAARDAHALSGREAPAPARIPVVRAFGIERAVRQREEERTAGPERRAPADTSARRR